MGLWVTEYVAGYGERPSWVLGWALGFVIVFAVLHSLAGVVVSPSGAVPAPSAGQGAVVPPVAGAQASPAGQPERLAGLRHFGTCLYFSFVTFTTLGYGDVRPCEGVGRVLASAEAVFGFVLMSLFLVCFVRKFSR